MSSINEGQDERGAREPHIANAKLQQTVEMGRNASILLENPAYEAAWKALRNSVMEAWRETATTDTERMQLLHAQLRMVDGLQNVLTQMVMGGKDANARLSDRVVKLANAERNESAIRRGVRAVMQR